jgi:hypothetical protein
LLRQPVCFHKRKKEKVNFSYLIGVKKNGVDIDFFSVVIDISVLENKQILISE